MTIRKLLHHIFCFRSKIQNSKEQEKMILKIYQTNKNSCFFNLFYQINFISSPFSLHELQIITNQFQGIWTVKSFIFWWRAIPIALDERVTIYYKLVFWPNRWQSSALLAISWQLLKDPLNLSANFSLSRCLIKESKSSFSQATLPMGTTSTPLAMALARLIRTSSSTRWVDSSSSLASSLSTLPSSSISSIHLSIVGVRGASDASGGLAHAYLDIWDHSIVIIIIITIITIMIITIVIIVTVNITIWDDCTHYPLPLSWSDIYACEY